MWQLLQTQSCKVARQRLLLSKSNAYITNILKAKPNNVFKRHLSDVKEGLENSAKSNSYLICSPWKLCTGVGIGLAARLMYKDSSALCKAQKNTRIIQRRLNIQDDSAKFDWKRLIEYLKPHKWLLAAAVASALTVAFLNVYIPAMLGTIVNVLAGMKSNPTFDFIDEIKLPALKLVSLYIGQAAFTFLYIHLLSQVGEKVACQMKQDLFVSILQQDMAFFDRERTGELVNRLTVDVQDFKSSFKQTISGGLRAITQVIGSAVSLLVISPHLTALTMVCVPSVVIGGTFIGSLLRKLSREAQSQVEKATLVAEEAISNIRTVRAFAGEENEAQMFGNECEAAADLSMELGLGVGLFQAGTNLFLNGMVLGTMFLGGHLMSTGQMSAGDVMAFLVNAQTVQRSVAQLSLLFGSVVKGVSAGGRVFEYINMVPQMDSSGTKTIKYHEFRGDIEFKNVTFAYPTRPDVNVLRNFTLKLPAARSTAIVGSSGSGKSTAAALLERFYDIDRGQITIDDVDIKDFDVKWLRGRALGLISQEPVLFATSVRENIRYGKPDASDDEVYKAAMTANAHEFISGFPEGYDTLVGERGMALSGGQKQRIAIARAVLKNPPILILDEATSALDSASEKVVQTALETAAKGRTVLVIAHRLSTVMNADLIVVLNKGRIVEMGTHDQLKKLKGYYWNLIKQQDQETESTSRAL
ncbi:mitochondrial potassium channel ATP-binding subunit [Plodia interpunctella]|uniref:mitochondrial potassium channel ATP-binding subunit n=1 Tax=Plodia interpunctella TaxID=58824 RepID=UPI0023681487|nr:mitochondrial potassium channel ATP-binding subunit [Plodia interpunctella]